MTVFGELYSKYYDLLYKNKNYVEEADYIHSLLQTHCPGAVRLLELGSGTGKHARLLAGLGYEVLGIERSEAMLAAARDKQQEGTRFQQGDIRSFRLFERYDAAIALFHVVSYMDSNEDLLSVLRNVGAHLRSGGIFLFDCWYGPAVLTDRPTVRVKRLEDDDLEILRIAEPHMVADENRVDVHYRIMVKDKKSGERTELEEAHRMRYLFTPEIAMMLNQAGMKLEAGFEFMSGKAPGFDTWNVLYAARKP